MENKDLTLKGEPRKSNAGRKAFFGEETKELRKSVPISHYDRLSTILDYELSKLKK